MLPEFFVVGAQKAGTTALHNYIMQHPEVYLPRQKETKFFVEDRWYSKGIEYYEPQHFGGARSGHVAGEVDPDYMYHAPALQRMAECLDLRRTKFIFVFRDPVERAFSHYLMTYRRGLEDLPFAQALEHEAQRIARDHHSNMHYSYLSRGYYMRQLDRFLARVERRQMHFALTEDLRRDPVKCLKEVFEFLEVDPDFVPPNIGIQYHRATVPRSVSLLRRINGPSPEKRLVRLLIPWKGLRHALRQRILEWNQTSCFTPVLQDPDRAHLTALFARENERLSNLIGRDLSHWARHESGIGGAH